MSDMTNYLRDKLGEHIFSGVEYTMPENVYLVLFTAAPTVEGGGTEVSGGGYARQLLLMDGTGTDGEYENQMLTIVNMPEADVVALGISDDDTAGNLLVFKDDFGTISLQGGDTYVAAPGTITFKFV